MANVQFVEQIPVDILLNILLRLPAKSLGRFVCVSKLWATIIRGDDFIKSFSFRSSPKKHPRFLLSFYNQKNSQENWQFFSKSTPLSTPAPGPPGLTIRVAEREPKRRALMVEEKPKAKVKEESIPPDSLSRIVFNLKRCRCIKPSYAYGLISFVYGDEQFITNPTTGKSITLPTPTFQPYELIVRSYLGYDPMDARYNVLCMTNVSNQVLTLGLSETENWRMINCSTPHSALGTSSVCIDGVLYYTALTSCTRQEPFLARFDLRSETLEIASMFPEGFGAHGLNEATLINYHGKVALVTQRHRHRHRTYTFDLWVLENANKQEWSKQDVSFPHFDTREFNGILELLGVSEMGEFIFAANRFYKLYLYFLNPKSNRLKSIQLQGSITNQTFRDFSGLFTFMDHVESLMFI